MLTVRTQLRYSSIHGLGCFAAEDIKKGRVVWRYDEGVDLTFSEEDLTQFPISFREFLSMYAYSPISEQKRVYVLCADNARHMNHDENPNLDETPDGLNVANRDIKAGEELTCNYLQFDKDAASKLGK